MKLRLLIAAGLLLALASMGLGAVQAARAVPVAPTQYETMALCTPGLDCRSYVSVYAAPEDLAQMLWWCWYPRWHQLHRHRRLVAG